MSKHTFVFILTLLVTGAVVYTILSSHYINGVRATNLRMYQPAVPGWNLDEMKARQISNKGNSLGNSSRLKLTSISKAKSQKVTSNDILEDMKKCSL